MSAGALDWSSSQLPIPEENQSTSCASTSSRRSTSETTDASNSGTETPKILPSRLASTTNPEVKEEDKPEVKLEPGLSGSEMDRSLVKWPSPVNALGALGDDYASDDSECSWNGEQVKDEEDT